jgi:hypothetical protein
MCPNPLQALNPFGGGGSSGGQAASTSTATAGQTTNVSVTTPVNVSTSLSVNTSDLADAIKALAGSQLAGQALQSEATVQAADITAQAQATPSPAVIIGVFVGIVGLLFTTGFLKLPRDLRA